LAGGEKKKRIRKPITRGGKEVLWENKNGMGVLKKEIPAGWGGGPKTRRTNPTREKKGSL